METFVVRLWISAEGEQEAAEPLHGILERVGSADSMPFRGGEQLLQLLRAGLALDPDARTAREQRREGTCK
jgi:hypothetical protein